MPGQPRLPRRPGPQRPYAPPGGAPVNSELTALLTDLGIPLPSVSPAASNTQAQDDPPVYTGNGTKPLSQLNQSFYGLSAQQIVEFQLALVRAGRLQRVTGEHDEETYDFWRSINERAANFKKAGVNRTPGEILDSLAPVQDDDEPQRFAGNVNRVSDALTLETQMQQAARARLGRKLKRSEVARFVAVYQGLERQSNTAMDAAAMAAQPTPGADGRNSEVFAPPGADAAADQFIDKEFAQEAAGQDAYGYLNVLRGMIGGG